VIIILESFRAKDVGAMGGKYNVTPFFDSLVKKGIFFTHFYSLGVQTAKALSSSLGGSLIYHGDRETKYHPKTRYYGLGLLLDKIGYKSGIFLVGQDSLYDKMHTFFTLIGFKKIIDIYSFPKNSIKTCWGILDEITFEKSIQEMDNLEEPFYFVILTLSNHHPYDLPKKEFFKFNRLGYYGKFLAGMNYTDYALSLFFKKIQKKDYFKRTIFLIYGDHGESPMIESATTLLKQNLSEENIRVPFLIYAPGLKLKPRKIKIIGSHLDILPTICHLIGYYPSITHWPGKSLLDNSNPDRRWAFAQTSFGESFIAIIWKNYKLTYNFTKNEFKLYKVYSEYVKEEEIPLSFIKKEEMEYYKNVLISLYKVTNYSILKNRIFDMSLY
jgi:phosphoglycerol transferase MdoB-like AlkP superfamily enzyme